MTVKRLDSNQPDSFSFNKEDNDLIEKILKNYPKDRKQSAVVPSLYIAQKRAGGWLPEKAISKVAEILEMPKMRVLEIATFYSMFNLKPTGNHFIQVCGTTPCWLRGSDKIKKAWNDHSIPIKKFGRYPHRNIILNRKSSYEEEEFLKLPNSSW